MALQQVAIIAAFLGIMTIAVSLVFFATRRLKNSSYWLATGVALMAAFLVLSARQPWSSLTIIFDYSTTSRPGALMRLCQL